MSKVNWPGASGKRYEYSILTMNSDWNKVAGNYIFAKEISPGLWKALYAGETENFNSRMTPNHECWKKSVALGATHVHARVTSLDKKVRCAEETDLILHHNPPVNQKVSLSLDGLFSR